MSWSDILQRFLDPILYPYQELLKKRKERERIISAYRKNRSRVDPEDLDSPGEYETLVGYRLEYLKKEAKERHDDLERDLKKYDREANGGSTGPTRRRLGQRGGEIATYTVPPGQKNEIVDRMQGIIEEIEQQNQQSKRCEYALYVLYLIILVVIVVGLLGFDPTGLLTAL